MTKAMEYEKSEYGLITIPTVMHINETEMLVNV